MIFDLQPHLGDKHVRLRPMEAGDFESLYTVAADPLIWEQHPASDRYQRDVFRAFFDGGIDSGGGLIIHDAASGAIIGASRYYFYDLAASKIVIGYTFLARTHWGGIYNSAVKRLMLTHAFRFVDTVVLHAGPDNHRSCRAIEKLGGKQDGEVIGPDGRVSRRYVIHAADWMGGAG